jgi:hypothetical protein
MPLAMPGKNKFLKIKPTRRRQLLKMPLAMPGKNKLLKNITDATPSAFAFMVTSKLFT